MCHSPYRPLNTSPYRIAFALFLAAFSCTVIAQDPTVLPTRGKRFWASFMQNGFGAQTLKVHVVSTTATNGTVSIPLTGWSFSFSVAANGVTVIDLPLSAENSGSGSVQNKGFLVQSQDSVNVFISSFQNYTHDLSQVLPEYSLGTVYRVDAYQGLPNFNNLHKSELMVVATADGTQVQITPSVNAAGGFPAGTPFTVNLDAGQTYQVQAATDALDLTGTLVQATSTSGPCRPFAVFGGSMCATAPGACSACDHIFEQCIPVNTWGTRYFTVPVNGTTSGTYRVLAHQDGTQVTIGGGAPILLNAGQRYEVNGATTPVCIDANLPVSVAQILEGFSCAGNGDPSLFLLSPVQRTSTKASFHTPSSAQINSHSISVVVPTAAVAQLQLDGVAVNSALFQSYVGCTDRKYAKIPVTQGVHRLQCSAGFQAYMFGLGFGESYAASVHDIGVATSSQDSVVCGGGPITLNSPEPLSNALWYTVSAPGVSIAAGNSITISPTQSESYTVIGQLPVSGCPRSFTYHVGMPLTIPTLLTANGSPTINVCQYEGVQLGLVPPPSPAWFDVEWGPASSLDDPNSTAPIATPLATTWYKVHVSSPTGCGELIDSILVTVQPGVIADLQVSAQTTTVCAGNSTQLSSRVLRTIARDDFDAPPGPIWTAVQGGAISSACGSFTGSALYFNGNGIRAAQTLAYNTVGGGFIRFQLKIATGSAPCDDAEAGEDVIVEYSTNNGINWSGLATLNEDSYPSFTLVDLVIPPVAQTANTMFRIRQLANSGTGQDNWSIDAFTLTRWDDTFASYSWSQGSTLNNPNSYQPIATPAASGWYVLSATDPSAGCVYRDSVYITIAPAFSLNVTPNTTLCSNSGLQLNATPSSGTGIIYAWTPNNGTLSAPDIANPVATPTQTTTYTVNAVNDVGCAASGSTTITVGQLFSLNVTAAATTLCPGQNTQLNAVVNGGSGLTYAWSGAGLNFSNIAAPMATPTQTTTYTCTVTHTATGCSMSASIIITVNTGLTADAGADVTLCSTLGHQLTVQHNVPNAIYSWTPAANLNASNIQSPTIMVNSTATYTVTVVDPFGCSATDQIIVTSAFTNVTTAQNVVACANAAPVLNAPATGVSYSWSTGAVTPSIVPVTSGPHTVTITDAQGCQAISTFNVTLNPLPVVNLGPDLFLCGVSSQLLNAGNAGSTFLWNTNAATQTINATTSGTYSVTVTNANNCSASDAMNIQFNAMPVDVLQDVSACISSPPMLNAGNTGSTFLWNGGATTQSITPSASGTYSVTVTTPQQCSATFDAIVTLAPVVTVSLGNDTSICQGQSILLDAGTPGASHLWSTGATTQSIPASASGTYSVTVSNASCSATDAISISVNNAPGDVLANSTQCIGGSVTLDAGNVGSTYLWSTSATGQSISVSTSATYSVTVTNSTGCAATFDSDVLFIPPPTVFLGADTILCEGQHLVLDAGNQGSTYAWSNGSTSRTIAVQRSGIYSVNVNNGYCSRNDAISVHFNPSPQRMAVREFHACLDDDPRYVVIDAGNPGARFDWSTGESTPMIMAGAYGWYYVHIMNAYDCSGMDSARVIEHCPATIFIPNTFTPNGDGVNDYFMPVGKSIASVHLMVFDRWGEMLFETRDLESGWDGTYRGEFVKNDMYVWHMTYTFFTDKDGGTGFEQRQMGNVQVLR
ncbi:MAG: gliding motility-associated C-terminal domain-containing protein [Flavobacteriales bacterium]|nr:gliding motility-associated C-terminal domain-containing protein [Flavobacteriales bacterium]